MSGRVSAHDLLSAQVSAHDLRVVREAGGARSVQGKPPAALMGTTDRGLREDGLPLAQPSPGWTNAGRWSAVPAQDEQKPL